MPATRTNRTYMYPCTGYVSSIRKELTPPGAITADSVDWLVSPNEGQLMRRFGYKYYNEIDATAPVGILESKWNVANDYAYCRHLFEYVYPGDTASAHPPGMIFTDNEEKYRMGTIAAPTQGGAYLTIGSLFDGNPADSAIDKIMALPYVSGGSGGTPATGISRCTFDFQRRFLASGCRNSVSANDWYLFPNFYGTPMKWNGYHDVNNVTRIQPWGHLPPMFPPTKSTQTAATGASDKIWRDGDSYYLAVVFQMDDGSFSMPSIARPVNSLLTNGIGLIRVGTNPTTGANYYQSVTYTGIPIGPFGTKNRILCRSRKVNTSTHVEEGFGTGQISDIDPLTMYVVDILNNNTATTYLDTSADDDAALRDDQNVFRLDHLWCPPSRYAWNMERRISVGYSRVNPCAILVSWTGDASSRDKNTDDSELGKGSVFSTIFKSAFVQLYRSDTATYTLKLAVMDIHRSGSAPTPNIISITPSGSLTIATTFQQIVDAINTITIGVNNTEFAATLVPGVDGSHTLDQLAPTVFDVASCTITSGLSTIAGTGFADVALGMKVKIVSGTGTIPASAIIVNKTSDQSITIGNISGSLVTASGSGTATLRFWDDVGNDSMFNPVNPPPGDYIDAGNIRTPCSTWPAILGFKGSYLETLKVDKRAVRFTGAAPGSAGLAPQSFFNALANVRSVPDTAGIMMGGAPLNRSMIGCYSNGIYVFENRKNQNTGEDYDYQPYALNIRRGCQQFGTIVHGDGWVGYWTSEGYVVTDGEREVIITNALYDPSTGIGNLADQAKNTSSYPGSLDLAKYQKMHAAIMGSSLHLSFSDASHASSMPNYRQVYDFSAGIESSGLGEVLKDGTTPFPWSAPIQQRVGAMIRTADQLLFGANDESTGSMGNGQIYQLEIGSYDTPVISTHLATLVASTKTLTANAAGGFLIIPVGAKVSGPGLTGTVTVVTRDTAGTVIILSAATSDQASPTSYTFAGQEISAVAYTAMDSLGSQKDLKSAQNATILYTSPTSTSLVTNHSRDKLRASSKNMTLPNTGTATSSRYVLELPSTARASGEVVEFGFTTKDGSKGAADARPQIWGLDVEVEVLESTR